jgi:transposase-like protein
MKSYSLKEKSLVSFWQEMVSKSKVYSGSIRQFCKENRLSEKAFYEWRRQLEASQEEGLQDRFVKVHIDQEQGKDSGPQSRSALLPDAKWVAEFVREFLKGLS